MADYVEMRPYARGVIARRNGCSKDSSPYGQEVSDNNETWACGWEDQNILMNRGISSFVKDSLDGEANDATAQFENSEESL